MNQGKSIFYFGFAKIPTKNRPASSCESGNCDIQNLAKLGLSTKDKNFLTAHMKTYAFFL